MDFVTTRQALVNMGKRFSTTCKLTKNKPVIVNNINDRFKSRLFPSDNSKRKGEGGLRTQGLFKESYNNMPLISIVTVVFNGEEHIEETIQSVVEQTYDNVEYVIIDGGSTDGTLGIIKQHENKIDYWVSENDQGIYDAMNKGISLCIGDVIGIINADDFYEIDALSESVKLLLGGFSYSYGDINFIKKYGKVYKKKPVDLQSLDKKIYQEMVIPHISMLIKRCVYKKIGVFDTEYKIAGDHDFLVRMHVNGIAGKNTNMVIANAYDGGVSKGFSSNIESARIANKYGQSKIITTYKFILFVFKKIILSLLGENLSYRILKFRKSRHA